MIIRTARAAELPEVGDIRVAAYRADGFLTPASTYAGILHGLGQDGSGDVLVAAGDDGRLLGTVMLQYWPDAGGATRGPGEAEIRALAVRPEARGKGAGHALLTAVIERATANGVDHLVLATLTAMRTAHRMYEKAGFARLPERDWHPSGEESRDRLLVFGLRLKPGQEP